MEDSGKITWVGGISQLTACEERIIRIRQSPKGDQVNLTAKILYPHPHPLDDK